MSRTGIIVAVTVLILALTGLSHFVASSLVSGRARNDALTQVSRARELLKQNAQLEALSVLAKAERLAADGDFTRALKAAGRERQEIASRAFGRFMSNLKDTESRPDFLALVDQSGDVIAMSDVANVDAKMWKNPQNEPIPAIKAALTERVTISEIWGDQRMMKVGVSTVIDTEAPATTAGVDSIVPKGAVVIAYAATAVDAQRQSQLLGAQLAFAVGERVYITSFRKGKGSDEDSSKQTEIMRLYKADSQKLLTQPNDKLTTVDVSGSPYFVAAVALRTEKSKALANYPDSNAVAIVLSPKTPSGSLDYISSVVLMLGGAALALALLGMFLIHRRLMAQVDPIELGVADIINGNIDRTFVPVGQELDGLANGLNVMMARLLGRPEPGEEAFDDEGNQIVPGRVEFDEAAESTPGAKVMDPDLAALAQESEPDYYKRLYTEYLAARKAVGQPDEVSFENFIAKIKMNEGKLKAQHQSKAVRFRVITKEGKVSLKPVPIFA